MIYIKIYLDKDENGVEMLVFDSVKQDTEGYHFFTVAGKKHRTFLLDYYDFEEMTSVIGVEQVAISPEAKEFFLSLLSDESTHGEMPYGQGGDFTMRGCYDTQYGWNSGQFAFCPPEIKKGDTKKTLHRGEHFTVECVFSQIPLDYMTLCLNETLKNLDLTNPADEKPLLDAYYAAMIARGEEPGDDLDSIRHTPFPYMTEAQKDVIRRDYRSQINRYDAQEWHDNGDFIYSQIIAKLIQKYFKSGADIETITNSH